MILAGNVRLLSLLLFSFSIISFCNGLCNNYKTINDPFRSTANKWAQGKTPICDRTLQAGWYRFKSDTGDSIPTTTVPPNSCGTQVPMWLKGTLPTTPGGIGFLSICRNFNGKVSCPPQQIAPVLFCPGNFYIYRLTPPPACPMAYCAGDKVPCPLGFQGVPPNCKPKAINFRDDFIERPVVTYKVQEATQHVTLQCQFKLIDEVIQLKTATYEVEWLINGQVKPALTQKHCTAAGTNNPPSCPGRKDYVAELPGTDYAVGNSISCRIRGRFVTTPNNKWSAFKESARFFAGIKVHPATFTLNKCQVKYGSGDITIQPTIPIRSPATVKIQFRVPEGLLLDTCEIELKNIDKKVIRITPKCGQINVQKTSAIILNVNSNSQVWSQQLKAIKVNVLDTQIKMCYGTGDPHYRTFDGKYYDFMGLGDFRFYKNTKRHFEVQTRQWICGRVVSCICGLVIRDHNDVVEFDSCNNFKTRPSRGTPLVKRILSKGRLAPGTSIKELITGGSATYEIILQSGARIRAVRSYWGMNVYVHAPKLGSHEGLCGDYNDNPNDEFKDALGDINNFGNIHSIAHPNSYFDSLPTPVANDPFKARTCKCQTAGPVQCIDEQVTVYRALRNNAGKEIKPELEKVLKIGKRAISYSDEGDFNMFDLSSFEHEPRAKRAAISKAQATQFCSNKLRGSKATQACLRLVMIDVDAIIRDCMLDLSSSGDYSFVDAHLAVIKTVCEDEIVSNETLIANNNNNNIKKLVAKVTASLCPNDCSSKGSCVSGKCVCNQGYTALDCSISLTDPPELYQIRNQGLCDVRKRPCRMTTVFGARFLDSPKLTCHVEEFKVTGKTWTPLHRVSKQKGKMDDLLLATCKLPPSAVKPGHFDQNKPGVAATGLQISVSNNGVKPSLKKLQLIIYDSVCQACNVTTGCTLKQNSCLINGYCFAQDETNPKDWCYQCKPGTSNSKWTRRQVNQPPTLVTSQKQYAVLYEQVRIPLRARDPEGRPVKITLAGGPPGARITADNVFHYTVTQNKTALFGLKVSDECGASSRAGLSINMVGCPCTNGGSCVPATGFPRGSGHYTCLCPFGFTGDACEKKVNGTGRQTCNRGIHCPRDPEKADFDVDIKTGHQLASHSSVTWISKLKNPQRAGKGACAKQGVVRLRFNPRSSKRTARIDLYFDTVVSKITFDIGDSPTVNGYGGDAGTTSNAAEIHSINRDLRIYSNTLPGFKGYTIDKWLLVVNKKGAISDHVSIYLSDESISVNNYRGFHGDYDSPYLFTLNGQKRTHGANEYDVWIGMNRVVLGTHRKGTGLCRMAITWV